MIRSFPGMILSTTGKTGTTMVCIAVAWGGIPVAWDGVQVSDSSYAGVVYWGCCWGYGRHTAG